MFERPMSRLEALAQELVEGSFGRLFGGRLEPLEVANRLARAIEDSLAGGQTPAAYEISLNADDYRALLAGNPDLAEELSQAAWQLSHRAGVEAPIAPEVRLRLDSRLRRHKVRVTAHPGVRTADHGHTTRTDLHEAEVSALEELLARDAFLIVQGRRHVPLERSLTTLGRQIQNDIVLESPTISRWHAQIRWRFGHFILYDVSGRGRTLVNGDPVTEHVLQVGDVIALSDVLLIFGEGYDVAGRADGHLPGGDGDTLIWRTSDQ